MLKKQLIKRERKKTVKYNKKNLDGNILCYLCFESKCTCCASQVFIECEKCHCCICQDCIEADPKLADIGECLNCKSTRLEKFPQYEEMKDHLKGLEENE